MTQKNFNKLSRAMSRTLLVAAAAGLPATTLAAGFQLTEQSVSGLGRAFAGASAFAEDASTVFYNPAGLVELDHEVVLAGSVIALGADFDRTVAVDAAGQPLTGGEGGDVGKLGGVPAAYYAYRLNPEWVFGLGVNAPFGLATDYDPDWIGRYQGVYSQVSSLNINPSLGWKINDNWSLGFGVNLMHFRVKLTNTVDYGAVCFGRAANPVTCSALGLTPQSHDGYAEIEGDSWGYGFNIGALWQNDTTRVGIHYRSEVDQDLDGDARFENVPLLFAGSGTFIDQGIQADFTTPQTLSLSIVHDVNADWTISGDISYTGWDSFEQIRVNYDNYNNNGTADPSDDTGQPPTIQPENWENVMRYSFGVDWRYSEAWTLRSGVAFDETPVPDEWRTVRLPDDDRTWLSFGATWHLSESTEVDFGYAHLFIDDSIPFAETGSMGDTLAGTYEASADIAGVELRYQF